MANWLTRIEHGVFVTGTDTGVGKTAVAGAIARVLADAGRNVGVMKPIASGCLLRCGELISPDADFLQTAAHTVDPIELVCPVRLRHPLAPTVAAALEHKKIDLARIRRAWAALKQRHECMIVEGIGGLLVSISARRTVADLARDLGLPVLIVARPALGTINHTLLTVEAARRRDLSLMGVIIDRYPRRGAGLAERTNPAELERVTGLPVLAILKDDPKVSVARGQLGSLPRQLV